MFCNQCEQTAKGTGCTVSGVCGKKPEIADQQDHLVLALRRFAAAALRARKAGVVDRKLDHFAVKALFHTLTNVNFDPAALNAVLRDTIRHTRELEARVGGKSAAIDDAALDQAVAALSKEACGTDSFSPDANVRSAMQLLLYGLKGVSAYADHALVLGQYDPELVTSIYKGLVAGMPGAAAGDTPADLPGWLGLVLDCGKANLRAMELLEKGNTDTFGHPVPTPVSLGQRPGKAILISGHDLADLHALLEQTQGKGINVYTHGEMLPAHGYPKLKAFPHLAGHFGTAWQNQHKEFPAFPGPVLFTTNCIQNPQEYSDKIFTCGTVGWPGVAHCQGRDFSAVINKALAMPGFTAAVPGKEILTGFGRQAVLGAAPAVLEAAKSGALRHIFLVGGCDGAKPGRNYYTEFVEKTPPDTLVLTLACGKFRFFDKDLGKLGPFPRLLDMGQCNDAYAAVQVALALADALKCGVNDLPLSLILSWYEQKAVSILLTLLALGVKNIRLGPSLPAFVSPDILNVLVKEWNIAPISTPDQDLKAILG